ncbi:MAG: hypothetical protein Q8M07_25480, partial [Prosthecobacter sp.]|nr:hypothetical protein [Prosthecobacter sp.]
TPLPIGKLTITGLHQGKSLLYHCDGASPAVALGESSRACYLPDGRLAFAKDGAVLVRDLKSGTTTPLRVPASATGFDVLPKGEEIVYVLKDNDAFSIHVSQKDGTGSRQLKKSSKGEWLGAPKWSPDGKQVLFVRGKVRDVVEQVFVMDAEGGSEAALSGPGGIHASPCWSPDGTEIAFVNLKDSTIHLQRLDGTKPRIIDKGKEVQPMNRIAWSPDGQWIAYGRGALNEGHGIWIVRPDGSDERQIITSKEREIHWMPLSWAR